MNEAKNVLAIIHELRENALLVDNAELELVEKYIMEADRIYFSTSSSSEIGRAHV